MGESEETGGLAGFVIEVIEAIGELGVGLLVLAENLFPPIPSEVILPFAGFSAARGDIDLVLAWIAATLGALVGAWGLYTLGAVVGYDRLHDLAGKRWFFVLGQSDLERGERFFERHGNIIVLGGRCIPLVRSVVSVPAGVAHMPLVRFSVLTVIGSGVWNAIFIGAGYALGERWDQVEDYVAPLGYAVMAVLIGYAVFLAARKLTSGD